MTTVKVSTEILDVRVEQKRHYETNSYRWDLTVQVAFTADCGLEYPPRRMRDRHSLAVMVTSEMLEISGPALILRHLVDNCVDAINKKADEWEKTIREQLPDIHFQNEIRTVRKEYESTGELGRIRGPILGPFPPEDPRYIAPSLGRGYVIGTSTGDSAIDASRYDGWTGSGTGSSSRV